MTDSPPSVGPGPLLPPVVPEPTRRAGPSRRVLLAAALTTLVALGAVFLIGRDDGGPGAGGDRDPDAPSLYTVRRGDTITSVAALHAVAVEDLLAAHDLTLADSLEPGTVLEIPALAVAGHEWPEALAADPIRAQQNAWFDRWAAEYDVPAALLKSLTWKISRWNNASANPDDGDLGIGRIDPNLLAWINDEIIGDGAHVDPRSPEGNVQLAAAYLGHLLEITGGDRAAAVATYYLDLQAPDAAPWSLGLQSFVAGVLAGVPDFEAPPPPTATTTTTTTTEAD